MSFRAALSATVTYEVVAIGPGSVPAGVPASGLIATMEASMSVTATVISTTKTVLSTTTTLTQTHPAIACSNCGGGSNAAATWAAVGAAVFAAVTAFLTPAGRHRSLRNGDCH